MRSIARVFAIVFALASAHVVLAQTASRAFAAAMHSTKFSVKDNTGALLDVTFDSNGALDRESFMTKVVNGKQRIIATLPPSSVK